MPQTIFSSPKSRDLQTKVFQIVRTDSSTQKMFLPKDAFIVKVYVHQQTNAVTGAATYNVGFQGGTGTELLNAFSLPTTSVGFVTAGTAIGTSVNLLGANARLATDKMVIGTFNVGTSSAGGTGVIIIEYFVATGDNLDS